MGDRRATEAAARFCEIERRIMELWRRLLHAEDGTTSVEYCVVLSMILIVVIVAIASFGNSQDSYWGRINNEMRDHGF